MNEKEILQEFAIRRKNLSLPKIFVEVFKDYNIALILDSAIYETSKTKQKDGYFIKTYDEWYEDLLLPKRQIDKAIKKLEQINILNVKHSQNEYKVDLDMLVEYVTIKNKGV